MDRIAKAGNSPAPRAPRSLLAAARTPADTALWVRSFTLWCWPSPCPDRDRRAPGAAAAAPFRRLGGSMHSLEGGAVLPHQNVASISSLHRQCEQNQGRKGPSSPHPHPVPATAALPEQPATLMKAGSFHLWEAGTQRQRTGPCEAL